MIDIIKDKILNSRFIRKLLVYSKRNSLYGFGGMPIYDVLTFFWSSISRGSIGVRASSVAFNFFLGFFPAVLFLFNLIPYIPIEDFHVKLLDFIRGMTPKFAYETISTTIYDIATNKRASLLSIGFFSALYFSTKGVKSLISAFNATALRMQSRHWFSQQLISIFLMIILIFLLVTAIVLMGVTGPVLDFMVEKKLMFRGLVYYLIIIAKWVIQISLFLFIISTLYYYAPAQKSNWKFFSAGSVVATIICILLSIGFIFYVSNFGQYNKLYGSIGTLIIILMWMYLNAFVVLLGFELNVSIKNAKLERTKYSNKTIELLRG